MCSVVSKLNTSCISSQPMNSAPIPGVYDLKVNLVILHKFEMEQIPGPSPAKLLTRFDGTLKTVSRQRIKQISAQVV